jgi:aryl-alcohol dehydrogenase-like predicted oxidoreductase
VERVRAVGDRHGVSVADVAIAWTLAQPGVTGAIVGSTSPEHVRANAAAGDLPLDAATLEELERVVSPGSSAG